MARHEDELRNQRLGWLFTLNGFLFAALAFAWNDSSSVPLVVVLSALGILVALSAAAAEHVTSLAIGNLRELWAQQRIEDRAAPLTALGSDFFETRGGLTRHIPKLYPWRVIPWLLIGAWIALMVVKLVQGRPAT